MKFYFSKTLKVCIHKYPSNKMVLHYCQSRNIPEPFPEECQCADLIITILVSWTHNKFTCFKELHPADTHQNTAWQLSERPMRRQHFPLSPLYGDDHTSPENLQEILINWNILMRNNYYDKHSFLEWFIHNKVRKFSVGCYSSPFWNKLLLTSFKHSKVQYYMIIPPSKLIISSHISWSTLN